LSSDKRNCGALTTWNDESAALIKLFLCADFNALNLVLGDVFCGRDVLCGLANEINVFRETALKGQDTNSKTDHVEVVVTETK
jgi:hypothetical protein